MPVGPNQDKPDHQQPSDCKDKHGRSPRETPVSVSHHHERLREGRVSPAGYRQSCENPREKAVTPPAIAAISVPFTNSNVLVRCPKSFPAFLSSWEITYGMSVFKNRRLVEFAKRKAWNSCAHPCRFKALQYHNIQKGLHLRRVRLRHLRRLRHPPAAVRRANEWSPQAPSAEKSPVRQPRLLQNLAKTMRQRQANSGDRRT